MNFILKPYLLNIMEPKYLIFHYLNDSNIIKLDNTPFYFNFYIVL